jgi:hypothetical protein
MVPRGTSHSSQGATVLSIPTPSVASLSTISGGINDVGSIDDIERSLARRVKARDCKALIDELKLKSLLGVGSMGTVYNAELMGQRFVVKVRKAACACTCSTQCGQAAAALAS